ncbi:MAG: hypothetical protein N3E40_06050, partial [Dehalococcoidia bacterium]|nr:hypothetical protein [Dehalococcoidia bacterium]
MVKKLFCSLLLLTLVISFIGYGLPAKAESTPGQKWYINGDVNSGDAFTDLTICPYTPATDWYTYAWGMFYVLNSYEPVTFPAGDWT